MRAHKQVTLRPITYTILYLISMHLFVLTAMYWYYCILLV